MTVPNLILLAVNIQENEKKDSVKYVIPPGIRENNYTITIRLLIKMNNSCH